MKQDLGGRVGLLPNSIFDVGKLYQYHWNQNILEYTSLMGAKNKESLIGQTD